MVECDTTDDMDARVVGDYEAPDAGVTDTRTEKTLVEEKAVLVFDHLGWWLVIGD